MDERVDELIDWMVDRNLKQWRTVVDYVNRRRQADYDERLIGEVGDGFEYNRGQLLRSVGKNAQDVVQRYDRERESEKLALSIQGAVAQTAALEVGAVGIGAVVVALATTRFLDATGLIAAAIIAGYGLFILPNRRRKARAGVPREDGRPARAPRRGRPATVRGRARPLHRGDARGHSTLHPLRPLRARPHEPGPRRPRRHRRGDRCAEGGDLRPRRRTRGHCLNNEQPSV